MIVNVGGQDYDVTTFTGSYNANKSKFNLPSAGGLMPWWGSDTTSQAFAPPLAQRLVFQTLKELETQVYILLGVSLLYKPLDFFFTIHFYPQRLSILLLCLTLKPLILGLRLPLPLYPAPCLSLVPVLPSASAAS